jgi:hypothetical protein
MAERWPVIDTHQHIGVGPQNTFIAEEELLPFQEREGVDISIIYQNNEGFTHRTPDWNPWTGNDYVAKVQRLLGDRAISLARVNQFMCPAQTYHFPPEKFGQPFDRATRNETLEELERCIVELGMSGLKSHPMLDGCAINHPFLMRSIFDLLTKLQDQVKRRFLVVVHCMGDSVFNSPEALADIAKYYPDLLFIAAHSGHVWGEATVSHVLGPLDNVMFDLTGCGQKSVVIEAYNTWGVERFTNGWDYPYAGPGVVRAIVEDLCESEEERQLVYGGNLAKYLGIPKIQE